MRMFLLSQFMFEILAMLGNYNGMYVNLRDECFSPYLFVCGLWTPWPPSVLSKMFTMVAGLARDSDLKNKNK